MTSGDLAYLLDLEELHSPHDAPTAISVKHIGSIEQLLKGVGASTPPPVFTRTPPPEVLAAAVQCFMSTVGAAYAPHVYCLSVLGKYPDEHFLHRIGSLVPIDPVDEWPVRGYAMRVAISGCACVTPNAWLVDGSFEMGPLEGAGYRMMVVKTQDTWNVAGWREMWVS
jgi:hypothetical protein